MLNKEEKPYLSTSAAIEYHGKSKSEIKPSSLLQLTINRAALRNDQDLINYLRDNGAQQVEDLKIGFALNLAIENGNEDSACSLIRWDDKEVPKFVDNETRDTFLHKAALKGLSKACSLLIGLDLKIDAKNKDKSTPLHCAVASGDIETVRVLVDAGASLKIKNNHKNTAIRLARLHGKQDILTLLENKSNHTKPESRSEIDPLDPASSERISRIE